MYPDGSRRDIYPHARGCEEGFTQRRDEARGFG